MGLEFDSYLKMWEWSVSDLEGFWSAVWEYFRLFSSTPVIHFLESRDKMPGARWLTGARLNHAEHLLRRYPDAKPALLFEREDGLKRRITREELRKEVSRLGEGLRSLGVRQGDRVGGWLPNCPEAVIAFLASASIGAIWSSCSSDFGHSGVLDRFGQIRPKVLIAADGYLYNGKAYPKVEQVRSLVKALPSVEATIIVPYLNPEEAPHDMIAWNDAKKKGGRQDFERVGSDHPLWILFSSGTTGLPKPLVHSHGGILLEHAKTLAIHNDLKEDDVFFWYTSTGWMMWNYLVGGLMHGSTIVLYDGSPSIRGMETLWEMAERLGVTYFGTSAAFISSSSKAGVRPNERYDLKKLRGVGSTGSPLSSDLFEWVYRNVKDDLWLASMSGGTDVCTAFVGGCPVLPVKSGRIQCRFLGSSVDTFDDSGRPVKNAVGELVLTAPMPSMPIYFWNDEGSKRYVESYFSTFPGVWRHGDWATIYDDGTVVIYGRSDATLKRRGIRIGTSEIYRVVERLSFVEESLVVDLERPGGDSQMILFIATKGGEELSEAMKKDIFDLLREELSPRHVPDKIYRVPEIPKTLNGKKMEIPVKKILKGAEPEDVVNLASVANPQSLRFFVDVSAEIRGGMR